MRIKKKKQSNKSRITRNKKYFEAVDNYSHALEFVSDCYKTKRQCNEAVDTYPPAIHLFRML